ncbi:MAG: hypothetical protein KGJ59_11265 [Bacteroidota bacterium]|nr:hypothetical protein [Bacteroidota bacterium]
MTSCLKIFGALSLSFLLVAAGCRTQNSALQEHKAFVTTYAGLLLLHEKEKMYNHLPDSLYQMKVDTFFLEHHLTKKEFRNKVADLSTDEKNWKNFLQEVSRTVDSLRNRRR